MTREMEDIELVIKINENDYHRIVSGFANEDDAILFTGLLKNGTPLPKGHGRLVDADWYAKHHINGDMLKFAPTVIEADKVESEYKE